MSDDRLFASNNAIGRKWYFLNLIILAVITAVTKFVMIEYIIPGTTTEEYKLVAKGVLWFLYGVYIITFFSLIDRRIFDIFGTRDSKGYRNLSSILVFAIFWQIFAIYCQLKHPQLMIAPETIVLIAVVLDIIFFTIVLFITFIPGKISNLSYEEYRNKIKYE